MKHKLLSLLVLSSVLALSAGCIGGKLSPGVEPTVAALDTAACTIIPIIDPASSAFVGSVCAIAGPGVNAVLTGLSAKRSASSASCRLVPITADGKTSLGEVCDAICGDMTKASTADPCPAVDARLHADGVHL